MMRGRARLFGLVGALALLISACAPAAQPSNKPAAQAPAAGQPAAQPAVARPAGPTRVTIGVTETIESQNPYADSVALGFGIWCEVLGCLVGLVPGTPEFAPALATSWTVEDPTTWVFHLRREARWNDGSPFTAADVVHSINRIANDRDSKQKANTSAVADVQAIDDYTVRIITKAPTSSLLTNFADLLIMTSKAQYDQHGPDAINSQPPLGTGPYSFKELVPNQYMVIAKTPNWWGGPVDGPDEVIYRIIREPEVRVTALLNGEIQIAQFIPSHMVDRVKNAPNAKVVNTDSTEVMFLAMQPKVKPFDSKLVRQAVAHAVDREGIIQGVLMGQARLLHGPVQPGVPGYNPALQGSYPYNPQKARELLAQAGYPDGVDVELVTPVGRYTQDKVITEAITSMLNNAGFRARLSTPEWPTMWADVQAGKTPFYYMGRSFSMHPSLPLSQYFETGMTPRIGWSNPTADALFARERATFPDAERNQLLGELMAVITEEAPAHFLWTHTLNWGMTKNIDYTPRPDGHVDAALIRVRQ
jgi:peptide/nickel transport system substrate-binding protein